MKYYFIVNPVCGNGAAKAFIPKIQKYFEDKTDYFKIYVTTKQYEGIDIVKSLASTGEQMRIYAVGGDGTVYDVVNGAAGYKNVAIGVIPCGSGNDFVKAFGGQDLFLDVESQIKGSDVPIDLIKFEDKYSINIASMGMDAEVVNHHNRHRVLSKINGTFSYTFSVFTAFIFNMNSHFRIVADGEEIDGTFLFVVLANGRYYGGGFNPTPYANMRDGLIELLLITEVSRAKLVKLMQKYRIGEHLDVDGLCVRRSVKNVKIYMDKEMSVQLDGEVFRRRTAEFDVVHNGINLILPSLVNIKSPEIYIKPKHKAKLQTAAENISKTEKD